MKFKEFDEYDEIEELEELSRVMDLEEFAKRVESGELTLQAALSKFSINSLSELSKLRGNNDMDLLQIAIKNNYNHLISIIMNGINIARDFVEKGVMSAQVNGSPINIQPSSKTVYEHIDLLSGFDLYRNDGLGNNSIGYALSGNKGAFYKIISKSNDSRLKSLNLSSPTKGNNLNLVNYLLRSSFENGIDDKELDEAIFKLIKDPNVVNQIGIVEYQKLMRKVITSKDEKWSKIVDTVLPNLSRECRTDFWQVIMGEYGGNEMVSRYGLDGIEKLLNLQEKLMGLGVDITPEELQRLDREKFSVSNIGNENDMEIMLRIAQMKHELFHVDTKDLSSMIGKSPDVLRATLGKDYSEQLRQMILRQEPSREVLKNAIQCKWDGLEQNPRLSLFSDLGKNISVPNEQGQTLFSELSSQEIVKLYSMFNPQLSNEAVMDITSKSILHDIQEPTFEQIQSIKKVYDAVYHYTPEENIVGFCNTMLQKKDKSGFFDFELSVDNIKEGMLLTPIRDMYDYGSNSYKSKLEQTKKNSLLEQKVQLQEQKSQILAQENQRLKQQAIGYVNQVIQPNNPVSSVDLDVSSLEGKGK